MLSEYVRASRVASGNLRDAPEGEGFFAEVPALPGVWANANTLEECRDALREVIDDWILVRARHQLELAILDGVT